MILPHRQIAVYLDDPDRLSSDGLEHARQVLRAATARKTGPAGSRVRPLGDLARCVAATDGYPEIRRGNSRDDLSRFAFWELHRGG